MQRHCALDNLHKRQVTTGSLRPPFPTLHSGGSCRKVGQLLPGAVIQGGGGNKIILFEQIITIYSVPGLENKSRVTEVPLYKNKSGGPILLSGGMPIIQVKTDCLQAKHNTLSISYSLQSVWICRYRTRIHAGRAEEQVAV